MKTISQEEFEKKYGTEAYNSYGTSQTKEPGYFSRVFGGVKKTAMETAEDLSEQAEKLRVMSEKDKAKGKGILELGRSGLRTVGGAAKIAFTPLMEAPGIKEATEFLGEKISGTETAQKYAGWAQKHPDAAKDIENFLDIAGLFGGEAVEGPAAKGITTVGKAAKETVEEGAAKVVRGAPEILEQGKKALGPPAPSPMKAVGQVLQGKTRDIQSGVRALKVLDTAGVKTYDDLLKIATTKIESLAQSVDKTLDNTRRIALKDLKITGKTTGGKAVSTDYIGRALAQLDELYTKIGDDLASKNIRELGTRAKKEGLTRKEVNDLARLYGQEFGEKAFGKLGEPLTSVGAQGYEHLRKALKVVARKGIGSKAAKAADEAMSDLYRMKDLVKRNAEAVNKLQQKIQERGLVEKVGYQLSKYANILTGGGLRGVVGGLLPRGVGYKVMNALDLQVLLERNLKIIQDALKAGDRELISLLRKGGNP